MGLFENLGIDRAEFMNTVRESLPPSYKADLPRAMAGQTQFDGIGEAMQLNKGLQSVWHEAALTLIGKILQRDNKIVNPLSEFEGDLVANGDKIEEMILDTAGTFAFNPSKAEKKLFERRAPELRSIIHTSVRDVSSSRTIQDTEITKIFHDASELDRYVIQVSQSMLAGNEAEKYYATKEKVSEAIMKGAVRTIDLGSPVTAKQIQKKILKVSKEMIHPNRFYNMGNVGQIGAKGETGIEMQADFSELRMMLPISTSVELNVDFFASAFHLDAVQSGLAIKEVDFFPDIYEYTDDHVVTSEDLAMGYVDENFEIGEIIRKGARARRSAYLQSSVKDIEKVFDGSRVQAVILDRRALVIHPQLPVTFTSVSNPLGRYVNVILQDKTIISWSPFMPACVILADDPTENEYISDVLIDGESVVNSRGVANVKYSEETGKASEVFDEPESKKIDDEKNKDVESEKSNDEKGKSTSKSGKAAKDKKAAEK